VKVALLLLSLYIVISACLSSVDAYGPYCVDYTFLNLHSLQSSDTIVGLA